MLHLLAPLCPRDLKMSQGAFQRSIRMGNINLLQFKHSLFRVSLCDPPVHGERYDSLLMYRLPRTKTTWTIRCTHPIYGPQHRASPGLP